MITSHSFWCVVYTRPLAEFSVQDRLRDRLGVRSIVVRRLVTERRRFRSSLFRSVTREVAHFPRYVFCHVPLYLIRSVREMNGVTTIVKRGEDLVEVPGSVIDALGAMGIQEVSSYPSLFQVGQSVVISDPYEGLRAVVRDVSRFWSHGQLGVGVYMMGSERTATVSASSCSPA